MQCTRIVFIIENYIREAKLWCFTFYIVTIFVISSLFSERSEEVCKRGSLYIEIRTQDLDGPSTLCATRRIIYETLKATIPPNYEHCKKRLFSEHYLRGIEYKTLVTGKRGSKLFCPMS
jgi:hypothetical protein